MFIVFNMISGNETQLLARLHKLVDEVIAYDQWITEKLVDLTQKVVDLCYTQLELQYAIDTLYAHYEVGKEMKQLDYFLLFSFTSLCMICTIIDCKFCSPL
ncbi:hypothetical protein HanIR_Chr03g0130651 [Helianthus annuus]|nr:hypothetical protein HanIR_Chr03g0130651 [Helianthus annuus]